MGGGKLSVILMIIISLTVGACGTLIAPYDDTFDQSLNKFSEDTAKYVAAATAGGPERSVTSKETVAYYAGAYNLLDRLTERARLTRGLVPCPTDESLKVFTTVKTSGTKLPDDYKQLDCREFQLYAVRIYVDQLNYSQKHGGFSGAGRVLQTSILGAIQTFLVNKPAKGA